MPVGKVKKVSTRVVTNGSLDLVKYQKLDKAWQDLGIAAPARRGLIDNKLFKLVDLKRITKADFLAIHGIGPIATQIIIKAMNSQGVKFKSTN